MKQGFPAGGSRSLDRPAGYPRLTLTETPG